MEKITGRKGVVIRELTAEEIQEARKTGYCPFCKGECKSFWTSVSAIQEFYLDDEGEIEWGTLEGLDNVGNVECKECGAVIPEEIWEAWFKRKEAT